MQIEPRQVEPRGGVGVAWSATIGSRPSIPNGQIRGGVGAVAGDDVSVSANEAPAHVLVPPGRDPEGHAWRLYRRGIDHGWVCRGAGEPGTPAADWTRAWERAAAIHWPGVVELARHRDAIEASLGMFERLRADAEFLDELDLRLRDSEQFRYAGSTIDQLDAREIERVFVDVIEDGRRIYRDVTARLSWIADDPSDLSLRIRFSYGHESLGEWLEDPSGMPWAAALCEATFPEGAAVTSAERLMGWIRTVLGESVACAERIVYSNAPGGGAVFHQDADPGQRGVLFAQLAGRTAWLALPRTELGALLAASLGWEPERAIAALDEPLDEAVWTALNGVPEFSQRVAAAGGLFVLEPGDALVMATHDARANTWHSVFALGDEPNLAHSYGLFVSD